MAASPMSRVANKVPWPPTPVQKIRSLIGLFIFAFILPILPITGHFLLHLLITDYCLLPTAHGSRLTVFALMA